MFKWPTRLISYSCSQTALNNKEVKCEGSFSYVVSLRDLGPEEEVCGINIILVNCQTTLGKVT